MDGLRRHNPLKFTWRPHRDRPPHALTVHAMRAMPCRSLARSGSIFVVGYSVKERENQLCSAFVRLIQTVASSIESRMSRRRSVPPARASHAACRSLAVPRSPSFLRSAVFLSSVHLAVLGSGIIDGGREAGEGGEGRGRKERGRSGAGDGGGKLDAPPVLPCPPPRRRHVRVRVHR